MNSSSTRGLAKWVILICTAITAQLLFPVSASAPPRPGARRPPAARSAVPRHAGKGLPGHKRAVPRPARTRFVRSGRYWHRYHAAKPNKWMWNRLGYKYYAGGESYVVLPAVEAESEEADGNNERLEQMQELIELVHEWRVLNESQEVHERLAGSDNDAALSGTVTNIRNENEKFDAATRKAMQLLVDGDSAQADLELARTHLKRLIELVEALPTTQ